MKNILKFICSNPLIIAILNLNSIIELIFKLFNIEINKIYTMDYIQMIIQFIVSIGIMIVFKQYYKMRENNKILENYIIDLNLCIKYLNFKQNASGLFYPNGKSFSDCEIEKIFSKDEIEKLEKHGFISIEKKIKT